jgi:hypothetical protein
MADLLIGKFFISFQANKEEQGLDRRVNWNGQVRSHVKEGMYLVKLMNEITTVLAGVISFDKQIMVSLDDMKDWEFFDSREAWEESYGEYAERANERFRPKRSDTHYTASGSSPGAQS